MDINNNTVLQRLLKDKPKFHDDANGDPISWNTNVELLDFLGGYLQSGMITMETGSGYSTILFIGNNCVHTSITPAQQEFDRISIYCTNNKFPLDNVKFIAKNSPDYLPYIDNCQLDVMFVDGAHRFPFPMIDWYYGSKLLKLNGILIIDDTDIISCFILLKFMEKDTHWETILIKDNFAVFRKLAGHDYPGDWPGQKFSENKIYNLDTFVEIFI